MKCARKTDITGKPFFVYSITDFDLKDLTFWVFGVTIQPENGRSPNDFCSWSVFMTTCRPTVFFGADENSGGKSAKE